jgi:hypothetical protein
MQCGIYYFQMTKKRTKKPDIEIDENLLAPTKDLTDVELFLADFIAMQKSEEMASVGFSMSAIAAALGIPAQRFITWVKRGKEQEEDSPYMPEVILWKHLAKGWAVAKGLAESKVAQVDPKFFLTRGPARMLGDDWSEESSEGSRTTKETLDVTTDFMTALRRLREQGYDLNEIIDNDLLSIKVDRQEKPIDILEKHGINHTAPALPGPLAQKAMELDQVLQLQRNFDEPKK